MKIGNIAASGYRAEGDRLTVDFQGETPERVEALDGTAALVVATDTGEVVEWLRGFTLLSSVAIDRENGKITAVFRHVSQTETELADLRAQVSDLQVANVDAMRTLAELGGLVAASAPREGGGTNPEVSE